MKCTVFVRKDSIRLKICNKYYGSGLEVAIPPIVQIQQEKVNLANCMVLRMAVTTVE